MRLLMMEGKQVYTDNSIYRNYILYCREHNYNPISEDSALLLINRLADKGYSPSHIYKELIKIRYEDTCYTCPFFEGENKYGRAHCCYEDSCKSSRNLIAVIRHECIRDFLKKISLSPFRRVKEVSFVINGKQYIKCYKK